MTTNAAILILAEEMREIYPRQHKAGYYIDPLLKFMTQEWAIAKKRIVQIILDSAWEGRRENVIKRLFDAENELPRGLLADAENPLSFITLSITEAIKYGRSGLGTARSAKGNPIKLFFDDMTPDDFLDMKALWGNAAIYMDRFETGLVTPTLRSLVAKDASGNIHGAILYEKSQESVYVHIMESAPFNRGVQGHSGIGSNLLARAAADVETGGTLSLQGTTDSVGYYERIGMQRSGYMFRFTDENAAAFADEVGVSRTSRGKKLNPFSVDLTNDPEIRQQIIERSGKVADDYGERVKAEIVGIRGRARSDAIPKLVRGTRNRTSIILTREGLQEVLDNLTWQENFVDDLSLSTRERVKRLLNVRYGDFAEVQTKVTKAFRIDRDDLIQSFRQAVDKHAQDVVSGRISPEVFERRMKREITGHYPKLYRAGKGQSLTQGEREFIRQQVASQDKYLANFRQYIETQKVIGNELTGQINVRASLYAERGSAMYERGYYETFPDDALFDWVLQPAEHCNTCPILADNSPYTKRTLPGMPGEGFHLTQCGTNCKCIIELSTLYVTNTGIAMRQ